MSETPVVFEEPTKEPLVTEAEAAEAAEAHQVALWVKGILAVTMLTAVVAFAVLWAPLLMSPPVEPFNELPQTEPDLPGHPHRPHHFKRDHKRWRGAERNELHRMPTSCEDLRKHPDMAGKPRKLDADARIPSTWRRHHGPVGPTPAIDTETTGGIAAGWFSEVSKEAHAHYMKIIKKLSNENAKLRQKLARAEKTDAEGEA